MESEENTTLARTWKAELSPVEAGPTWEGRLRAQSARHAPASSAERASLWYAGPANSHAGNWDSDYREHEVATDRRSKEQLLLPRVCGPVELHTTAWTVAGRGTLPPSTHWAAPHTGLRKQPPWVERMLGSPAAAAKRTRPATRALWPDSPEKMPRWGKRAQWGLSQQPRPEGT